MTAEEAAQAIADAVSLLDGYTVVTTGGAALSSFPAVCVPLPELQWNSAAYNDPDPNQAVFQIAVVVKADAYAIQNLHAAIGPVVRALWTVSNADVTQAIPGTFPQGSSDLPCYFATCEVDL
jgi:hypothetical protein